MILEERFRELYESRAKIIKALAHPTRLFIIEELQKHERRRAHRHDTRRHLDSFKTPVGA